MKNLLSFLFSFTLLFFCSKNISAQIVTLDSSGLQLIKINHADSGISFKKDNITYNRLIGAVSIEHDGITMTCDSAHFYLESNLIEAFSNVNINKPNGVNAHGNYIKYTGNNNTAFMQGNVSIIDRANTLNTEEIIYNLKTKIGEYSKGGNLQNEGTTITSEIGTYNGYSQQTQFKNNVVVTNPKYMVNSQNLKYNINTKIVTFLSESTIIADDNTIETKSGTYDSRSGNANFTSRTSIENETQFIEGNKIQYYKKQEKAIATGDVVVIDSKENTQLTANYVEYSKTTGLGKANGNVVIIDSKNQNQITSNKAEFNNKTGFGKAIGNVEILDFNNDSRILSDIAEYNKQTGYGKATGNVYIENEGGKSYLTSNETEYNKKTGYAKATGKVVFIDTLEKSKLLAGVVEYNETSKFMLATLNPKLITLADGDSLFMRSDTMISIRTKDEIDLKLIKQKATSKKEKDKFVYNLLHVDSTYIQEMDTENDKKLIIANHHVKLFSDSMQADCDSLCYSQNDSIFKLYKNPILWSRNQQSNADTIFVQTINNKISELNLKNNALLVSMTGFETYYDQVSGAYINAYFENNEIQKVYVNQNAESLYYAKDDDGNYLGTNKAESSSMNVFFINKEVDKIVMHENPKGDFFPVDKLNETQKFLSTFKLLSDKKPKSKQDILEN